MNFKQIQVTLSKKWTKIIRLKQLFMYIKSFVFLVEKGLKLIIPGRKLGHN